MKLLIAKEQNKDEIYALYKSVIGEPYCVWNDDYPGMREIEEDIDANSLHILVLENIIIGAASVAPINELDCFDYWKSKDGRHKEIARVVVSPDYRGKGLAKKIVNDLITILKKSNCSSIHLSVAINNIPAYKTYSSLGFIVVGEEELFGGKYLLMEKIL